MTEVIDLEEVIGAGMLNQMSKPNMTEAQALKLVQVPRAKLAFGS